MRNLFPRLARAEIETAGVVALLVPSTEPTK